MVIAGPGPDDGDRTAGLVSRALRDAGVEVVYTDRRHTPEQLLATVVQEDADAVGLAVPSGGDALSVDRLAGLMAEQEIDDVLVFDATRSDVVDWLRDRLRG